VQDLANSDCIVIQGSNMAEAHPVAFQYVVEAKRRGATVIHVDPRFSRTSALAHRHELALADFGDALDDPSLLAQLAGLVNSGYWFFAD